MFLALREIWFARARFLMVGGVLALMSILIVIISGLSAGLVNDGVSSLKAAGAQAVAFEEGTKSDSAFTRSVLDLSATEKWKEVAGVEDAAPLGLSIVNAKNSDGTPVDLTLFGVQPGSFLDPAPAEGESIPALAARTDGQPTPTAHEVVVSETLKEEGLKLGDTLTLDRLGTTLTVVGFTDNQRTFGHVDVAYLPIDVWQEVHAGARAGEAARPEAYSEASVVVIRGKNFDLSAVPGTDARPMKTAYESSPGYLAESMTMSLIQWFLYAIAALVTGAFFLVWTIQRAGDIAVMRAMGATKGFLLRDSLGQAFMILVASILVGVAIALAMASWLETTAMPFAIEAGPVATGTALLFVFGMIGAAVAVLQVTRTDPLSALGENR